MTRNIYIIIIIIMCRCACGGIELLGGARRIRSGAGCGQRHDAIRMDVATYGRRDGIGEITSS